MNLQPVKKHESVTILLVPYDGYSSFPQAVDAIFKHTRAPFELIVVEADAPNSIRHELEKRKKRHKNMKIIYSDRKLRLAEAFNLGLPHIRTHRAFLMHNNLKVPPHWLDNLLKQAKDKHSVLCPSMSTLREETFHDPAELEMHGLLITKEILRQLGEFDEKTAPRLLGTAFSQWLKKQGVFIHYDVHSILEYKPVRTSKSFDLKFFRHQWDEPFNRKSLVHLREKWGLKLQESKYLEWTAWEETPLRMNFPKIDLKKFLQVLTKA